jgi:ATP-dependent DNA helicase RecQ
LCIRDWGAPSALWMGYDKPDLAFVVHYQAPDSPVAYYQQVGRAGRALDRAEAILLGGPEVRRSWEYFTTTAFPPRRLVDEVLGLLDDAEEPLGLADLQRQVNLGQVRLVQLLKVLDVEGAVRRVDGGYMRGDPGWAYDADRYRRVTAARRAEQAAMLDYLTTDGCLMAFLRQQLDDPDAAPCGRCQRCTGHGPPATVDQELVAAAVRVHRDQDVTQQLACFPQRHGPPGRVTLQAGMTGQVAADLARIGLSYQAAPLRYANLTATLTQSSTQTGGRRPCQFTGHALVDPQQRAITRRSTTSSTAPAPWQLTSWSMRE